MVCIINAKLLGTVIEDLCECQKQHYEEEIKWKNATTDPRCWLFWEWHSQGYVILWPMCNPCMVAWKFLTAKFQSAKCVI